MSSTDSNETKVINKSNKSQSNQPEKESSSLKRGVAVAGAMMAGSVAGAAGTEIYHQTDEPSPEENTGEIIIDETPSIEENQQQPAVVPHEAVQPEPQEEIQEVDIHTEASVIEEPALPVPDGTHGPETITTEEEITAEELIDPNDHDAPDFMEEFIGAEQVYTLDGSEMTVASIHNSIDGDMYLVDVDNDGDFDVILDANGNEMAIGMDDLGNPIMSSTYLGEGGAGDNLLTLSDMELANDTIDPLNDMDIANNTLGDDIQQDIIDTSMA